MDVVTKMKELFIEFLGYDFDKHVLIDETKNGCRCRFFTETNQYTINANQEYLGAGVLNRKFDAGEDWTHGNDLADGKFDQETWNRIIISILQYELVEISQLILDRRAGIEPITVRQNLDDN